ncbi:MAG: right-handed parallel beta-helix repeat-containing protein [Algibacter sp.]|uniref:right-handed parallel beta-helix repeat-containing protein n=1 Tax=Algibacter sp. TaxID=1872428 RepID=UPI0032997E16
MKITIKNIALAIATVFVLTSCNNEELFVDDAVSEELVVTDEVKEEIENPIDPNDPCDFDLSSATANATVIINCILDLEGQTVTLPNNVYLKYEGGDITNGTINFGASNRIDGELLNYSLNIGGQTPTLSEPIFNFLPERWNLVEGQTTSDIAQENNNILEGTMFKVKEYGATTMKIDELDAYFEISKVTSTTTNVNFYPSVEAINIPSDFNLEMTDNTNLRTFPNGKEDGRLIAFREVSNSSIKGGRLHGERDEHDYSGHSAGEGGNHLIEVHGSNDIVIDGVTMTMGSKGGLFINALNFTFQSNYDPSYNILVKNCIFKDIRRMSIAITDGYDIVIENNQFINTALDREKSDGGVVGFAINIEGVRKRDAVTNELIYYEKNYDITIRNNSEWGSRVGAFNIYTGDNVIIENNDLEGAVGWSYASNSIVRNNTFKASELTKIKPAISAGGSGETVFNNEIYGNTISGFDLGISAYHQDIDIHDNTIEDFNTGLQIKKALDLNIYNNKLTSTRSSSRGIMTHITWANNVDIFKNIINVKSDPVYFVHVNLDNEAEAYKIAVRENEIISDNKLTFSSVNGLLFDKNNCNSGVQLIGLTNSSITNNTINTVNSSGILISKYHEEVTLDSNTISVPSNTRFQCISDNSEGNSDLNISETTCVE